MTKINRDPALIKHGDWLFTCNWFPVQFDKWIDSRKNHFNSMNGSNHARFGCGLTPISAFYAKWFLDNDIQSLYKKTGKVGVDNGDRGKYIKKVKKRCLEDGIFFEGT